MKKYFIFFIFKEKKQNNITKRLFFLKKKIVVQLWSDFLLVHPFLNWLNWKPVLKTRFMGLIYQILNQFTGWTSRF